MADCNKNIYKSSGCDDFEVGDGNITFEQCGDRLGTISLDQCHDETIEIPCPCDGKLTFSVDGNKEFEFTANQCFDTNYNLDSQTITDAINWKDFPICDDCIKWCNADGEVTKGREYRDCDACNDDYTPPSFPAYTPDPSKRTLKLVKFWSESCGICHRMSHYDSKVAEELGVKFISIEESDDALWDRWVHVAKPLYDDTDGMGWPTYILVNHHNEKDFFTIGEVVGGSDKGSFRKRLKALVDRQLGLAVGPEAKCSPKVSDIKPTKGRVCPQVFGGEVELSVSSSCCEPNNGKFSIRDNGNWKNMDGMDGVSFPNDGGNNDWGSGPERKRVKINLAKFKYDIADGDWRIKWEGKCDQKPGDFSSESTIKQSSNCEECPEFDVTISTNNGEKLEGPEGEKVTLEATSPDIKDSKLDWRWYFKDPENNDEFKSCRGSKTCEVRFPDQGTSPKYYVVGTFSNEKCEEEAVQDFIRLAGKKPLECTENSDCNQNKCEKCENNKCVDKCDDDQECDGNGNCVDPPNCTENSDCNEDDCKICNEEGKCRSKCKGTDKPHCDGNGKCRQCTKDSHCPDGYECKNYQCYKIFAPPEPTPDPPSGECNDGNCTNTWWIDWDCVARS